MFKVYKKTLISCLFLILNTTFNNIYAQCEATATANTYEIYCGQSVELTAFGQSSGTVVLSEDFGSGFGGGWGSTPGSTNFSNPCSPGGVDGTPHAWMDDNTSVPRTLESSSYDLTTATAGVTICFDLLFATQGGNAPCEGPDETDEGVYLQYSIDGGANWITIHYFDPNGGNDPQLTNWNNWCFQIPAAAITSNTLFRWHQTADSGAGYDHWGIDNVEIYQNDVNAELVWQHDGYSYGIGGAGGANPTLVTPTTTTTYTVELTTGSGTTCTDDVTIVVLPPVYDVNLSVNPATALCPGDCADITGDAQIILDPGGIETYENNEFDIIAGTPGLPGFPPFIPATPGDITAEMNINVVGINQPTVTNGLITSVCLNGFSITAIGGSSSLADLEVILTCPSGTSITLVNVGDLTGNTVTNMCFEMGAPAVSTGTAPYSNTFEPAEPFSNLNGCTANGAWNVTVQGDNYDLSMPLGGISGWDITFDNPPLLQPVNASWSPSGTLSSSNTVSTQACPNASTNYTLTLDNGTPGCPTFDTLIPIVVNPCGGCIPPNLDITNLNECAPNTVDLNDAIDATSDPATITFHNTQNDANNSTNGINATVSTSNSYWIRAEDPADPTCFLTYEVVVTISPADDPSFTLADFCPGANNSATITGTTGGAFTFNPAPGDGATVDATSGEITNGVTGTTYTVQYTTAGACPSNTTETVTALSNPTFSLSDTDPLTCGASDGTITIGGLSPNTSFDITYDDDGTTVGPTSITSNASGQIILSGLNAGAYDNFIVENGAGCSTTDNTLITLNDPSSPTIGAGSDQTICDGDAITLTANNPNNAVIAWDNGVSDGVAFSPSTTTTYTVSADLNGCTASDQVTITVNPTFTFVVATNDPTACGANDGSIVISGLTPNTNFDVSYDFGGATVGPTNKTSNGAGDITISNLSSGGYNNILITPTSGCSASDNTGWSLTDPNAPTIGAGSDQTICNGDAVTLTANNPDLAVIAWDNGITDGTAYNPSITTTYTVTADLGGCISSDQVTITVNPLPNPIISPVNDLCENDAAVSFNSNLPGGTYSGNGVSGTQFNPNTAGIGTHTITYDYTDVNTCSNSSTININVIATPTFTVSGNDPSSCNINDGEIVLENLSPNTNYDLTYNDNGTIVGPTNIMTDVNGDYTINTLSAGNYSDFTIALASGCSSTDNSTITLTAPNSPSIDAGADITICQGENVTLTAVNPSGAAIVWDNGITDGTLFTPAQTTTYTVTADPNGCSASDQVTVTVNPLPNVNANGTLIVCQGSPVTLFGTGAVSYLWDNSVTDNTPFVPLVTNTYSVIGTDINGCQRTDQITVTVNPIPVPSFTVDVTDGCIPLEVTFTATGNGIPTWNYGDGATSTGNLITTHTYSSVDCFDVSLTLTDNAGCSATISQADLICTTGPPIAIFSQSDNIVQGSNPVVQFTNSSVGATSFEWHFGDGQTSTETNPIHSYTEDANNYQVMLIAYSSSSCTDIAYSNIVVEEDLLFYVPNTFTPDGDAHNQVFMPVMTSGYDPYKYTLLIFNRWGEPVFESQNPQIGWDGNYQSKLVQDGIYVWKIIIHDDQYDDKKEFIGHVNVLK